MSRNNRFSLVFSLFALVVAVRKGFTAELSKLDIYELARFVPEEGSGIQHFSIDSNGKRVFIGSTNSLYQLSQGSLEVEASCITGPVLDNTDCPPEGSPFVECGKERIPTTNYNKVLAVNDRDQTVITCGSVNQGVCQIRRLANISEIVYESLAAFVAANNEADSTVGYVGEGPEEGESFLYVATTYTGEGKYRDYVPAVCTRSLQNLDVYTEQHRIDFHYPELSIVQYAGGFVYQTSDGAKHSYFATVQWNSLGDPISKRQYTSKLARVCQSDEDYQTYTEVPLLCANGSRVYNVIQDLQVIRPGENLAASLGVLPGQTILFGVFSKGLADSQDEYQLIVEEESALCVFRMEDVEKKFYQAMDSCLHDGYYSLSNIKGHSCQKWTNWTQVNVCDTEDLYRYADSLESVEAGVVYEHPNEIFTSVGVASIDQSEHTVIFIGTEEGEILKLRLFSKSESLEYERVKIDNSRVLPDMEIINAESGDNADVYVSTKNKITRLAVHNCSQYVSCNDCLQALDPYCGWCTLERRCSTKKACPFSEDSKRWIFTVESTCPDITFVTPSLYLPLSHEKINLTIAVSVLPELNGSQIYQCDFGWLFVTNAMVLADNFLSCLSPGFEELIQYFEDSDHVDVSLEIKSTETNINFVKKSLIFYHCDYHQSCSSCVTSNWSCQWCINKNNCTHDSSSCSGISDTIILSDNNPTDGDRKGLSWCPMIDKQPDTLWLHVGVADIILITGVNFPEDDDYYCQIISPNDNVWVKGARINDTAIQCSPQKYYFDQVLDVQELAVSVSISWNAGKYLIEDIYGFKVTLYNCSIDREDCSRCLGENHELKCGWCGENVCTIEAMCDEEWWPHNTTNNCPPPDIWEVWPMSSPLEGNTNVTIIGRNLAKSLENVIEVTLAGKTCRLFEELYNRGVSLACKTSPITNETAGLAKVTVIGNYGTHQTSHSNDTTFNYYDPQLNEFVPSIGPKAGGTLLTIKGVHLNTGNYIQIFIEDAPCLIDENSRSEEELRCTTTPVESPENSTLAVYFDGARRTTNSKFQYTEDPNITDIWPKSTIQSGGRLITVEGSYLNSVHTPIMIVQLIENNTYTFVSSCVVLSFSSFECPTPKVTFPNSQLIGSESYDDFIVGFIMDGVEEVLELSEKNEKFRLTYFADPVYYKFEEDGNVKIYDGQKITVQGEQLTLASAIEDISITVGNQKGILISLYIDRLEFFPPFIDPGVYEVTVYVGNYISTLGFVEYSHPVVEEVQITSYNFVQIVLIVVTVFLVCLVITLATFICYKRKISAFRPDAEHLGSSTASNRNNRDHCDYDLSNFILNRSPQIGLHNGLKSLENSNKQPDGVFSSNPAYDSSFDNDDKEGTTPDGTNTLSLNLAGAEGGSSEDNESIDPDDRTGTNQIVKKSKEQQLPSKDDTDLADSTWL